MAKRKGDVILKSEPFVHVLMQTQRGLLCDFCFNRHEKLLNCTSCSLVRYCNRACQEESPLRPVPDNCDVPTEMRTNYCLCQRIQASDFRVQLKPLRSDWQVHKHECKCLQRVAPNVPLDSVRLFLRILIRYQSSDHNTWRDENGWRTFSDLQSNVDHIKKDKTRIDQFSHLLFTIKKLVEESLVMPPAEELLQIFGKMTTNTFTICDGEMQSIGSGIYLSASIFDHSCEPKAVVIFTGKTLEVRALDNIASASPENIFISYVEQMAPSSDRQKELREQYYFDCQCSRCGDTQLDELMMSYRCSMEDCSGAISNIGGCWKPCSVCGFNETSDDYQGKITEAVLGTTNALERLKKHADSKDILSSFEARLRNNDEILADTNVYKVRLLDKAFDACINSGEWEKALEYGERNTQPYQQLYPGVHPNVGIQLMRVGKLQLYLQRLTSALRTLHQAEEFLCVTHGRTHPLYEDLRRILDQCAAEFAHSTKS